MQLGSETEADSETTEGEPLALKTKTRTLRMKIFIVKKLNQKFEDDIEKRLRHSSRKLSLNLGLAVFMLKGLKVVPSFGSLIFSP